MKRWERLSNWLKEEQLEGAFITSPHNVFYLTGFLCHPHERLLGLFIFPDAEPFLVCPQMEVESTKQAGWSQTILGYDDVQNPWEMIGRELQKRSIGSSSAIAIEKDQISFARVEELQHLIPQVRFVSVDEPLNQFRLIKDASEIQTLRAAAKLADEAVEVGISALKQGCTEMEIVATIELEMKKRGVREMSFSTMVLFGEKSAAPHGVPGGRQLQSGDLVLFDLGVVLDGYCSDITRTVAFKEVNDRQKEIYQTVLQAQLTALNHCRPGVQMGEVDQVARDVIRQAGYGDYFPHRLGHGLGISVHEFPSINETNQAPLQEGMVFTVEPGIYVPEVGGVRIEDDVLVTSTGFETLTRFTKELLVV